MLQSLAVWEGVLKLRCFINTAFILAFTKIDMLEEQLKDSTVQNYLPDCPVDEDGQTSTVAYLKYLENRCLSLVTDENTRMRIRILRTNLVDPNGSGARDVLRFLRILTPNPL